MAKPTPKTLGGGSASKAASAILKRKQMLNGDYGLGSKPAKKKLDTSKVMKRRPY